MKQEEEIWKDIPGYPAYRVSNLGRVKKIDVACHRGHGLVAKLGIVKPFVNNGYWRVYLSNENGGKKFLVHRLVAEAFLPNPDNFPIINHRDENPKNNVVVLKNGNVVDSNLEWCTHKYNVNYGTRTERAAKSLAGNGSVKVDCLNEELVVIKQYESITEAAAYTNCQVSNIYNCCIGKRCVAGGYRWRFSDEDKRVQFKKPSNIRSVDQFTKTGDFVKRFKSIKEASNALGITYTNITECLRGTSKTAGGYQWRYVG